MFARALGALLISSVFLGCGSDSSEPKSGPGDSDSTPTQRSSPPGGQSELVGEWERLTTCQERVQALEAAGLGRFAAEHAASEGWIPGVTSVDQLEDPERPCQGAVPLRHGHFFAADGLFGSRDAEGEQVDNGTYVLADDRTVIITKEFGEVTFDFQVRDNKLFLTPVLPGCARNGCFPAQWAVAVAYPGLPWNRAE